MSGVSDSRPGARNRISTCVPNVRSCFTQYRRIDFGTTFAGPSKSLPFPKQMPSIGFGVAKLPQRAGRLHVYPERRCTLTRRTDGKIAFGIKEWIAMCVLLVGVATAWARMESRQTHAAEMFDLRFNQFDESIREIKADQKAQSRELKELRREVLTTS